LPDREQDAAGEQPGGGEFGVRERPDDRQADQRLHRLDREGQSVVDAPDDLKDAEADEDVGKRDARRRPQRHEQRQNRNRITCAPVNSLAENSRSTSACDRSEYAIYPRYSGNGLHSCL